MAVPWGPSLGAPRCGVAVLRGASRWWGETLYRGFLYALAHLRLGRICAERLTNGTMVH